MIKFNKEEIFIVTGASSGIGEKTALLLNELGASVVAVARNEERLNALKTKCKFPNNLHIEIKDLVEDIEGLPDYVKELRDITLRYMGSSNQRFIEMPLTFIEKNGNIYIDYKNKENNNGSDFED